MTPATELAEVTWRSMATHSDTCDVWHPTVVGFAVDGVCDHHALADGTDVVSWLLDWHASSRCFALAVTAVGWAQVPDSRHLVPVRAAVVVNVRREYAALVSVAGHAPQPGQLVDSGLSRAMFSALLPDREWLDELARL